MSLFGLFKKSKPNLTPNATPPNANLAPNAGALQQLAQQRISAGTTGAETPGVGFGPDFVNKSSNPIAQGWQNQFKQQTLPFLNSQYSSRGLGNSNLAANATGQAYTNTQNSIDQLMANFYQLNEQQKKNDITQGIGVGQQLDTNFLNQGNAQANQATDVAKMTQNQAQFNTDKNYDLSGKLLGTALNAIAPGSGMAFGASSPFGQGGQSGVASNVLGGMSFQDILNKMLQGSSGGFNPATMSTPPSGYKLGFNPFGLVNQ